MENKQSKEKAHNPPENKAKRSSPTFPRYNMETSMEVARVAYDRAGGTCKPDQLASFLEYKSTNNGAYLARIGAAKMYGFIESERGSGVFNVTGAAKTILAPVRESDSRAAKVKAFCSISLFDSLLQELKGSALPTEDGLLNLLHHKFNISKNKTSKVLRIFMESADYAHFFECDPNRLIEPVLDQPSSKPKDPIEKQVVDPNKKDGNAQHQPPSNPPSNIHPSIAGLLNELPNPGPWEKSHKEGFMHAFKSTIDFIYPEKKEGGS